MSSKKYEAVIFDMDGTLLNTLDDLKDSTNYALRSCQMPERSMEEIRHFVGNGVQKLIERAVPTETDPETCEKVFAIFKEYYVLHCNDKTGLYPGIKELLQELKKREFKIAVVSNKLQEGVDSLVEQYFDGDFGAAIGASDHMKKKPAKDMVVTAMNQLQVTSDQAIYVGDSEVDIATAKNSGLDCITVTWGFRTVEEQKEAGATLFADQAEDILKYLYLS